MPIVLRPHQQHVANFLKTNRGCLVYHGLGSGKTFTSIGAAEQFKTKSKLVVCPAKLRENYKKAIRLFDADENKYTIMSYTAFGNMMPIKGDSVDEEERINKKAKKDKTAKYTETDVVKFSPELFDNKQVESVTRVQNKGKKKKRGKRKARKARIGNEGRIRRLLDDAILILDEAHNIRNPTSAAKAFLKYADLPFRVILLTGTPLVNKPSDLVNMFSLIHGKQLPYKDKLSKPELDHASKKLIMKMAKLGVSMHLKQDPQDFPQRINCLEHKIVMSTAQYAEYRYYVSKNPRVKLELPPGDKVPIPSDKDLTFLNKVRQISNLPVFWKRDPKKFIGTTPKIQKLISNLYEYPLPAVIYSNFLSNGVAAIQHALEHPDYFNQTRRLRYQIIRGSTSDKQVRTAVNTYNDGNLDVLIISGAGGEGIDLKGSRQMHVLEQFWHSARVNQVIGRAIRYHSHIHLPKDQQNVRVFQYVTNFPSMFASWRSLFDTLQFKMPKITADQYLYTLSRRKSKQLEKVIEILASYSIEKKIMVKVMRKLTLV